MGLYVQEESGGARDSVNVTQIAGNTVSGSSLPITLGDTTSTVNANATQTGTWTVGLSSNTSTVNVNGTVTASLSGSTSTVNIIGTGTAGSAASGVVSVQGIASMTPLASNITQVLGSALSNSNPIFAQSVPMATGGTSIHTNSATSSVIPIASAANTVYGITAICNAGTAFLHFYNLAGGDVVFGTSTPAMTLAVSQNMPSNWSVAPGIAFGTGLSVAATATRTGTVAPPAVVEFNVAYK